MLGRTQLVERLGEFLNPVDWVLGDGVTVHGWVLVAWELPDGPIEGPGGLYVTEAGDVVLCLAGRVWRFGDLAECRTRWRTMAATSSDPAGYRRKIGQLFGDVTRALRHGFRFQVAARAYLARRR